MAKQTREWMRDRRLLGKALFASLKQQARPNGWRYRDGFLFRELNGWYVDVRNVVWPYEPKTTAELHLKPMAIDPLFWQIVGIPEGQKQPLSFRSFGAWTCHAPKWSEISVDESHSSPGVMASAIFGWAEYQIADIDRSLNLETFIRLLEERSADNFASLICALVLADDIDRATSLCRAAALNQESGGYNTISIGEAGASFKTFADSALEWLNERSTTAH
jgi:hypothetical protein